MNRIAIIGGGAAGTLTAVHLMREPGPGETEIVLIDRAGAFGPGVAYATREPSHLLNVPAVRMGGIAGEPEHFHDWLRQRGHQTGPAAFVPRGYFGDYLLDLLAEAEAASAGRVRLRRLSADATALAQPAGPGGPLEVRFSDGPALERRPTPCWRSARFPPATRCRCPSGCATAASTSPTPGRPTRSSRLASPARSW